ncbi:MAG: hypothetical protein HY762_00525 [Planctomycetes bacterium]|nr:hypothetical protein [Planctomycetota bacterium]
MKSKYLFLGVINVLVYGLLIIYHTFWGASTFLMGVAISFSISTVIGVISNLPAVFVSIFLAWGLWLLALSEGYNSDFIAGCAAALTIGVLSGFICSRPV